MIRFLMIPLLAAWAVPSLVLPAGADVMNPGDQGRLNGATAARVGNLSEGRTIRAGTNAANTVFVGFLTFNTAAFVDPIGSATLSLQMEVNGNPGNLELYGVSSADATGGFDGYLDLLSERNTIVNPTSPVAIQTLITPAAGSYNFDVTSFVSTERGLGHNVVGFIFRASNLSADGILDTFEIYDSNDASVVTPQLTLAAVPEPMSLALLGMGGLALVARRRRAI